MAVEIGVNELQEAVDEALGALRGVMRDTNQSGEARVHAALGILDFAAQLESAHHHVHGDWEEFEEDEEDETE